MNLSSAETIYTEVPGTNCYINDEPGVVTGLHSTGKRVVGAFVSLGDRPAMLYVTLGNRTGDRLAWHEVVSSREIDRDEFDRINTLDALRRDMGWVI